MLKKVAAANKSNPPKNESKGVSAGSANTGSNQQGNSNNSQNKGKQQQQQQPGNSNTGANKGLGNDEVDELKQAFELFDTNQTGKLDPKELKAAMQSLGFDTKNPTIFQMISELDTPESQKKGGINFDTFIGAIDDKLGDKNSKDGLGKIFSLFLDDPQQESITLASLKRIARELGEQMSNDELKDMLERASSSGVELTLEEFYDIMTKKSFA